MLSEKLASFFPKRVDIQLLDITIPQPFRAWKEGFYMQWYQKRKITLTKFQRCDFRRQLSATVVSWAPWIKPATTVVSRQSLPSGRVNMTWKLLFFISFNTSTFFSKPLTLKSKSLELMCSSPILRNGTINKHEGRSLPEVLSFSNCLTSTKLW